MDSEYELDFISDDKAEESSNPMKEERDELLALLKLSQPTSYTAKASYNIQPGFCELEPKDEMKSFYGLLYEKPDLIGTKFENQDELICVSYYITTDDHWIVSLIISDPTIKLEFEGLPHYIAEHVESVRVVPHGDVYLMAIYFKKLDPDRVFSISLTKSL